MKRAAVPSILVVVVLLAVAVITQAQQTKKIPRIGFLAPGSTSSRLTSHRSIPPRAAGARLYEGQNVVIELRFAEGKSERLPALVAELIQLKVDVIVLSGTPAAQVAKRATTTIPIVMGTSADPVGQELVQPCEARRKCHRAVHSWFGSERERLVFLGIIAGVARIAVLSNPTDQSVPALLKETKTAA